MRARTSVEKQLRDWTPRQNEAHRSSAGVKSESRSELATTLPRVPLVAIMKIVARTSQMICTQAAHDCEVARSPLRLCNTSRLDMMLVDRLVYR